MNSGIDPLPPLVKLGDCDGKWKSYIEAVFAEFYRDFICSQPKFRGKKVCCRRDPIYDGKEAGFWHCTSEGSSEQNRTPDLRRCERIRWMRYALEHAEEDGIDCWTKKHGNAIRHLVWLREEFLVILEERRGGSDCVRYYQLITAFCTPEAHRKRKYRRDRDQARRDEPRNG